MINKRKIGMKKQLWKWPVAFSILFCIIFFFGVYALIKSSSLDVVKLSDVQITDQSENRMSFQIRHTRQQQAGEQYNLIFTTTGNLVRIISGDHVLYEYGQEQLDEGRMLGTVHVNVTLPEAAYDQGVTVSLTGVDANASLTLPQCSLVKSKDATRYYIANNMAIAILTLLLFALSLFSIPALVILYFAEKSWHGIVRQGIYVVGILFCYGMIMLCSNGIYLIFSDNQYIWEQGSYIASYFMPLFFLLFFYEMEKAKKQKRILLAAVLLNAFFAASVLLLTAVNVLHMCDMMPVFIGVLCVDGLIGGYGTISNFKRRILNWNKLAILVCGMLVPIVVVVLYTLQASGENQILFQIYNVRVVVTMLILLGMGNLYLTEITKVSEERKMVIRRLQEDLMNSRIKMMMSQMQPHFLYNALASIREVILFDPDYAADLVVDFTTHLRSTIRSISNDGLISFDAEMENVKAYINIEKMRFGDKLQIVCDIRCSDFEVLPLSIQPLVENAVRHGVYQRGDRGGTVTILSFETPESWQVQIIDDGVGFDFAKVRSEVEMGVRDSTGLLNLIYRIEHVLHTQIQVDSTIGVGTTVSMTIPKSEGKKNEGNRS